MDTNYRGVTPRFGGLFSKAFPGGDAALFPVYPFIIEYRESAVTENPRQYNGCGVARVAVARPELFSFVDLFRVLGRRLGGATGSK